MLVTFEVLKLLISRRVREEQPENIAYMLVTFEVLKLLKSRRVREEQPSNTKDISVTFEVFRFAMPSIVVSFSQPLNHDAILVTPLYSANVLSNTTRLMSEATSPHPRSSSQTKKSGLNGPMFIPCRSSFFLS